MGCLVGLASGRTQNIPLHVGVGDVLVVFVLDEVVAVDEVGFLGV